MVSPLLPVLSHVEKASLLPLLPPPAFLPLPMHLLGTSCVLLATALLSCVVADLDGDNACQGSDPTALSLGTWLLGYGVADGVLLVVFCPLHVWLHYPRHSGVIHSGVTCSVLVLLCSYCVWGLFKLAWCVVGVVLVVRSHSACVREGTSVGVVAVLALFLQLLSGWAVHWRSPVELAEPSHAAVRV